MRRWGASRRGGEPMRREPLNAKELATLWLAVFVFFSAVAGFAGLVVLIKVAWRF